MVPGNSFFTDEMKVVLIEDERLTAEDLADCLMTLRENYQVVKILSSLNEARAYFDEPHPVDLIFSDIHLGDGLSFELFETHPPKAPVIFCTAYDHHALEAFKANGIDYILKPFKTSNIELALEKFERLSPRISKPETHITQLLEWFGKPAAESRQSAILVHYKDKIIPFLLQDVALFYIRNEVTHLLDFEQKSYAIDQTLDEIDRMNAAFLFRVNRQFIVNRKAVKDVHHHFARKLQVNLTLDFAEPILISKERSPLFLKWLEKN